MVRAEHRVAGAQVRGTHSICIGLNLIGFLCAAPRKLVVYDDWSMLSIHVALDNMVITDEIRTYCRGNSNVNTDIQ